MQMVQFECTRHLKNPFVSFISGIRRIPFSHCMVSDGPLALGENQAADRAGDRRYGKKRSRKTSLGEGARRGWGVKERFREK